VPPYLPDTPVVRADLARLYDNLAFDERNVGAIMAALKADGVLENTVVIATSDHGDGLPRMKRAIHDAGLRVPFIVRLPGAQHANTERRQLVSFVDLAPTILSLARAPIPSWMQGRAFLGPRAARPNTHVFAGADRFDNAPEWQRTVIDGRFQYIRNLRPDLPLLRPLPFRDAMPTMRELWRLHAAGALPPAIESYFTAPRPPEELYDLQSDPDTMVNLAADPRHAATLARLRRAYETWSRRTGDDSAVPEAAMVARVWPGMRQPATAAPTIRVIGPPGRRSVTLASATPGASIGWRVVGEPGWRLYTGAFALPPAALIEAKAIRYGYAESAAVQSR
jgi:arylsulfatase A-like enzyme